MADNWSDRIGEPTFFTVYPAPNFLISHFQSSDSGPQMVEADLRAPFRPQDLERDGPTVVLSDLGHPSSSDDKGFESYKPLA